MNHNCQVKNKDQTENTGKNPEETRKNANHKQQLVHSIIFFAPARG